MFSWRTRTVRRSTASRTINAGENENVVVNAYHHDHEYENKNVVVNVFHHDHENKTLTRTAQRNGQANVLLSCAEFPAEIDSAVESGDASEVHHE